MIWIVGAGSMARAYLKVLMAQGKSVRVIGRDGKRARALADDTGADVVPGGLTGYLKTGPEVPSHAIVCTPVETLAEVSLELICYGIPALLVEKPAALTTEDLERLTVTARQAGCQVAIGYNRRFFQSVLAADRLIEADGGVTAVNFEISEWADRVAASPAADPVKARWLLANSSHVIDLAFCFSGYPAELSAYRAGSLDWHRSSSRFTGAGVSERGTLISYYGYWDGPGRWSVECVTRSNRYYLKPMERLAVQPLGQVEMREVEGVDYHLDESFKPGLYLQVSAFLSGNTDRLCSLEAHRRAWPFYLQISSYDDSLR